MKFGGLFKAMVIESGFHNKIHSKFIRKNTPFPIEKFEKTLTTLHR